MGELRGRLNRSELSNEPSALRVSLAVTTMPAFSADICIRLCRLEKVRNKKNEGRRRRRVSQRKKRYDSECFLTSKGRTRKSQKEEETHTRNRSRGWVHTLAMLAAAPVDSFKSKESARTSVGSVERKASSRSSFLPLSPLPPAPPRISEQDSKLDI